MSEWIKPTWREGGWSPDELRDGVAAFNAGKRIIEYHDSDNAAARRADITANLIAARNMYGAPLTADKLRQFVSRPSRGFLEALSATGAGMMFGSIAGIGVMSNGGLAQFGIEAGGTSGVSGFSSLPGGLSSLAETGAGAAGSSMTDVLVNAAVDVGTQVAGTVVTQQLMSRLGPEQPGAASMQQIQVAQEPAPAGQGGGAGAVIAGVIAVLGILAMAI